MKADIQEHFASLASEPAWLTSTGFISYQDLESRIRRHAFLLQKHGAQAGDHWAVRDWSALDTFALLLAAVWQRIILFPLPDRLPASMQELMMQQVPLQGCLKASGVEGLDEAEGPIDFDLNARAVGIFTSGSTGLPKAILHSWKSLASSAQATNQFYGLQKGDTWLLSLDIAHVGGLLIAVRCFLAGATTLHLAEPKALAPVLHKRSPSFISLVPTQLYRFMHDSTVLAQLRLSKAIILGGAAAAPELVEQAIRSDLPVSVSYGSSETAAQCAALPTGGVPLHAGDVGNLLPGWEYEAEGDTLRVRGPAACLGYYQERNFFSAADAQGWMTLPDRILCDKGRLTVLGRRDGLFQVAGENVSPFDIVQALETLRDKADFIALPWHDREYGTIPILIVRSAVEPDLETLIDRLQKHLTGFQRPRRIYWHRSDDVSKPSRRFYEKALEHGELPLIWRQDLGRI